MEDENALKIRQERLAALKAEAEIKRAMLSILDTDAYGRLMNVKLANPALYQKIVSLLVQLARAGQVHGKISDEKLRMLLLRVSGQGRREGKISIKRK